MDATVVAYVALAGFVIFVGYRVLKGGKEGSGKYSDSGGGNRKEEK